MRYSGYIFFGLILVFTIVNASPKEIIINEEQFEIDDFLPSFSEPVDLSVSAYGIFDVETGEILLSHNDDKNLPIASVTKLFTAKTVMDNNNLDQIITITEADVATLGRAGKLATGQTFSVHELLFPLLLESSNDAGTALVRNVGTIMLGERSLADGSGLSAQNISSVNQLAIEIRNLYINYPHIFDITKLSQKVGEHTVWVNNSPVLDLPGYQGGKHGYTEVAGRTIVAIFTEPALNNREIGYIVLGSKNLRNDIITLRSLIENSVE